MIQVAVAAARAAKTAAKTDKKASRAFKEVGDKFYNARRRFTRSAQRNLDKAESATGATAERYRTLARQDLEKALATYDPKTTQKFSKPIRDLSQSLGVDLNQSRAQLKQMKVEVSSRLRETAEERSYTRLESAMQDTEMRRQAEARSVFNSPIGQRIIGGLVDVWKPEAIEYGKVNKAKMMQAIYDYFGVDNLADVLKKVEDELGASLYRDGEQDTVYETVKLQIQNKVADNTLVA